MQNGREVFEYDILREKEEKDGLTEVEQKRLNNLRDILFPID